MGRAVTISKIYRTYLNLKQFKMIKKRTVKQILCKSAFVFAATFVLSLPTYARHENEVKVNTEANIKGRVVDSKTQHPLFARDACWFWVQLSLPPPMPMAILCCEICLWER